MSLYARLPPAGNSLQNLSKQCHYNRNLGASLRTRPPLGILHHVRWHGGHGHSHGDGDETRMLYSAGAQGTRENLRVTKLGLGANIVLAAFKCSAGFVGNSSAMVADAGHSLSDSISDILTLWSLRMARKPASALYPWGHGKFDSMGAFTLAGVLVGTGLITGINSFIDLVYIVGEMKEYEAPSTLAAAAALVSIFVKELLYQITIRAGRRSHSQVTIANALHHRSDALSSVVSLVGIGGSIVAVPIMDPVAGIIVSGMIVRMAIPIGWRAFGALTDRDDIPPAVRDKVSQEVEKAIGLRNGKDGQAKMVQPPVLRFRTSGPYLVGDFTIFVKQAGCDVSLCEDLKTSIQTKFPNITHLNIVNQKLPLCNPEAVNQCSYSAPQPNKFN